MERIRWTEKAITFRNLVDNPSIQKPALVQIGIKSVIVGDKLNGEFIAAAPCKFSGSRFDVMEQEIVLSSKHAGIWKVISKATSKKDGYIHRLTTKDIERIYKQDIKNERATARPYICTKDIEAFEIHVRQNDPAISNGQRAERRKKYIEENVEFEIIDVGEVEYTPTEGERTSQDYVKVAKNRPGAILQMFIPSIHEGEQLIRNRTLRALYCTTKDESRKRRFLLEVNEQPCDIRPIASEGSTELRYLQSTQNLFDYMLNYGNDTFLYVKLLRGDPPVKTIEFDGYMVLKSALNGDRIPICRVDDLEVTLVSADLPVRVKLPTSERTWRSLPEIRAAELQCMQLCFALLARHESEMYVTVDDEKNTAYYLQSKYDEERPPPISRKTSEKSKKHIEASEKIFDHQLLISRPHSEISSRQTKPSLKQETTKLTRTVPPSHPASDKFYRDNNKEPLQDSLKTDRQRLEHGEQSNHSQRTTTRDRSMPSSSSFSISKTKTSMI